MTICPMPERPVRPYRAQAAAVAGMAGAYVVPISGLPDTSPGLPKHGSGKIIRFNGDIFREIDVRKPGGAWALTLRNGLGPLQQAIS